MSESLRKISSKAAVTEKHGDLNHLERSFSGLATVDIVGKAQVGRRPGFVKTRHNSLLLQVSQSRRWSLEVSLLSHTESSVLAFKFVTNLLSHSEISYARPRIPSRKAKGTQALLAITFPGHSHWCTSKITVICVNLSLMQAYG